MRLRVSAIALAVAASLPALASAVDFSYHGFSTAAYAQTDTDLAQIGYLGQPEGIDKDGTFKADSKLGLQVTARFNEMFSATVQGVAYADMTADWEPHLDWAFVRFQPISSLSARAGYVRAPTFMYSESVFIGYANTWVRTPLEVYNLSPAYQLLGGDLTWRDTFGGVTVSVQPYYGESELRVGADEYKLEVPEWGGVAASAESGSFLVRAGYGEMELGTTTPTLVAPVAQLRTLAGMGCGGCAIDADRLDLDGTKFKILDLGVQYDNGTDLGIVEYARRRSGSLVVPDMYSAYATYGRRFGGLMPYATYAIARRDDTLGSSIPVGSPFAGARAVGNSTNAAVADDQDTYSAGVRYEVPAFSMVKGAIVKLQYDHTKAKEHNGMFNNVKPGFDGDVDMISASFDFIF